MKIGSLRVVGTGIALGSHMTTEARAAVAHADRVFFLVADPIAQRWIRSQRPEAEDLFPLYRPGRPRYETYNDMVDRVLEAVREGASVCLAVYGHPGMFAFPTHEAVRRARAEGYRAVMYPGISATDCLFADLGVDPGDAGCQSYEATDFLVQQRRFDTTSALILWQIGVIGKQVYEEEVDNTEGVELLTSSLLKHYDGAHEVTVYEASQYPVCKPVIAKTALEALPHARISPISTLYVPPKPPRLPHRPTLARFGTE